MILEALKVFHSVWSSRQYQVLQIKHVPSDLLLRILQPHFQKLLIEDIVLKTNLI